MTCSVTLFFKLQNHNSSSAPEPRRIIMTMIYDETFNKCRQLQKVQTQIGSRGSTPRANKEEDQREVKMVLQSAHNGAVAGGGKSFFPSFELSAVLHKVLPCGNEVPNKMHFLILFQFLKTQKRCTIIFI